MEEYTKGISASHSNSSNTPGQKAKKDSIVSKTYASERTDILHTKNYGPN